MGMPRISSIYTLARLRRNFFLLIRSRQSPAPKIVPKTRAENDMTIVSFKPWKINIHLSSSMKFFLNPVDSFEKKPTCKLSLEDLICEKQKELPLKYGSETNTYLALSSVVAIQAAIMSILFVLRAAIIPENS